MLEKLWRFAEKKIKKFLSIIGRELSDEQWDTLLEFVKFGLIGVSNTVISYMINILVLFFMQKMNVSWDFVIANVIAFLLSVLWSFYWNNKYVFYLKEGEHRNVGGALLKTYISYGFTGIVLNNILSYMWIVGLHLSKYMAPFLNLLISIPINFVMNKFWAFGKGKEGKIMVQKERKEYKMKVREYKEQYFYGCMVITACIFALFYARYVNGGDIPVHTNVSKYILFSDDSVNMDILMPSIFAYPLYHIAQKLVHLLLHIDYASAAVIVLTMSICAAVLLFRKLVLSIVENTVFNRYFADAISLGAVVFGAARCWLNYWNYYSFQCSANAFHNPTVLFVRPFGIAALFCFIQFVKYEKKKEGKKYAIFFAVAALLSVGAKPSWALAFLPAMGIYTLYHMIRNKEIKFGIMAFLAVLPSLALMLFQQIWVSANAETLNVSVRVGGFLGLDGEQMLRAAVVTFPVVILLFRFSQLKEEPVYFIAITALVAAWLPMFFLTNGHSGDFSWGYNLAVQFATVITLAESRNGKRPYPKVLCYAVYLIFAYQAWSGLKYLWMMYTQINYWI